MQSSKKFFLCLCCLCLLWAGFGAERQAEAAYDDSHKMPYPSDMVLESAASVERLADVPDSPYYPRFDFYNMKSGGSLVIVAESCDISDHDQDGYSVISFKRLYHGWINTFDPDFSRNLFLIAAPK